MKTGRFLILNNWNIVIIAKHSTTEQLSRSVTNDKQMFITPLSLGLKAMGIWK